MSSRIKSRLDWIGWALLLLCLGAGLWYAQHQLIYSLLFFYQLLQFVMV